MLGGAGGLGTFIGAVFVDLVVGGFVIAARPLIVDPGNAIFPGYGDLIWVVLLLGGLVSPWIVVLRD